jgi:hypothetical protein
MRVFAIYMGRMSVAVGHVLYNQQRRGQNRVLMLGQVVQQ